MTEETIKRNIVALAHARAYLTSQIAQAYDSDDMVLYAILIEARSVLEDGVNELSGAGSTPSSELHSIPNDEAWWDESRQTSTDYVLFKDNKPVESLDVIYASESVIELFNDGFKLEQGEGFIKTTDLPIEWQEKYIAEITHNKSIL